MRKAELAKEMISQHRGLYLQFTLSYANELIIVSHYVHTALSAPPPSNLSSSVYKRTWMNVSREAR